MNLNSPLILASSSPRRKFLLEEAGFNFSVISPDIDESFPDDMVPEKVPVWLAGKKASVFPITNEVIIASDTVVILDGKILNKPVNRPDAIRMLSELSGKTHKVVTAVCIRSKTKMDLFDDATLVTFRKLDPDDIEFYIDHFNPLDKAGSYGAQDCLPQDMNPCSPTELDFLRNIDKTDLVERTVQKTSAGRRVVIIDKIDGAYFTVMGLPIHLVYEKLSGF